MQITHEQLLEILDWSEDFDYITESIVTNKHDSVWVDMIFMDQQGRFWQVSFERSYNDGIRDYGPYDCVEMEQTRIVSYRPKNG